jgi:hypothetical protein
VVDPHANDYVLVDRDSHRFKFDSKLRNLEDSISTSRIRADISDLVLKNVPSIKDDPKKKVKF